MIIGLMAKKKLHPQEIKARLQIKFGSMTAFERLNGLPAGSAFDVLRGRVSRKTMQAIAVNTGVSEATIKSFSRVGKTKSKIQHIAEKPDLHRLNERAK